MMRIQSKITLLLLMLSTAVIFTAGTFSIIILDKYFQSRIVEELSTQNNLIEYIIRTSDKHDVGIYDDLRGAAHAGNFRLTLIASDGTVIFESDLPPDRLPAIENHILRPEVQEALNDDYGTDIRHSSTLNIDMLYRAKKIIEPFPDDNILKKTAILRSGIPLTYVQGVLAEIRLKIILSSVIILLLVATLSFFISRKIASPVNEMSGIADQIRTGNLGLRMPERHKDELGKLSQTLNSMLDKLNDDIFKLRKLERVRTEFLGNVSHELRTPVFAIQGMLETLIQGALDDEEVRKDFVERALANTKRLNTLLNDLIEISRIESGDMKMSFRFFNLDDFVNQISSEMRETASRENVTLIYKPPADNLEVYGDKERLKQVMVNLLDNAIKYNKPGGNVKISCEHIGSAVNIHIEDTGVGIGAEHIPRIFERFYRVDKERSRGAGGTGLGLAIVKHIVEAHGSKMEVESRAGEWSRFSFSLKT